MSARRLHKKTYALLASMVLFGSLGNVLLSRGMKETGEILDFSPRALAGAFGKVFMNGSIWLGIWSLLVFFVSYLLLLSWADLSYVQPASAIGYALVAVLGYFVLGEFISMTRWTGVLFICAGVVLVGGTEPGSRPQLRRGGAARREPDRAKPQEKQRQGGVGQQIDFFDQHHPYPSSSEEGS